MTRFHLRPLIRQFHLWLGLSLGTLFALLGLTGSALVFYIEIDRAISPEIQQASALPAPGWNSPVWDEALATARREFPDKGGDWSFEVTGEAGPIPARYYPPSGHHGHHAERQMVWFAGDGKQVIRSEAWGEYLMSWIYELHMHLLSGEGGRQVVGWSGFAVLLVLATGLIAWWPRGRGWRKAVAFKREAAPVRRLYDLHKLTGLWGLALLVLLSLTGALLALPDVKETLFNQLSATPDEVPAPHSTRPEGNQIPIRRALVAAQAMLPQAQLAFIDVPDGGFAPIRLRVRMPGDPHRRFPVVSSSSTNIRARFWPSTMSRTAIPRRGSVHGSGHCMTVPSRACRRAFWRS